MKSPVEKYVQQLRESNQLQTLIEDAPIDLSGPLEFDPDTEETDEINVESTDEGFVITIVEQIEVDSEWPDFTGFTRNTVEGCFLDEQLQMVTLVHEYQHGPLSGCGHELRYDGTEVTAELLWLS